MMLFWFFAFLLAALTALLLAFPLWRTGRSDETSLLELNRRVFHERLQELEKDEMEGRIDAETLAELRTELQRNLLTLDATQTGPVNNARRYRFLAWLVLLLVPLLAFVLYYTVAAPKGLPEWWQLRTEMGPTLDRMLQGEVPSAEENRDRTLGDFIRVLQDRLQKQPENAEGWFMLGMSYVQLDMPQAAQVAFEHAWRKEPGEARYKVAYAQARIFSNEGQLDELGRRLLQEVVTAQPEHEGALLLLGLGAYRSADYGMAIAALERLQALRRARQASSESSMGGQIEETLASARSRFRQATTSRPESLAGAESAVAAKLRVRITVDRSLAGRFSPDDVVYVFARALQGPPMPVAVVKRRAADLPFTVELDDSSSVMPTLKLSDVAEVAVTARISRHGGPEAQAGDLEAVAVPVRMGGSLRSVELLIINERK